VKNSIVVGNANGTPFAGVSVNYLHQQTRLNRNFIYDCCLCRCFSSLRLFCVWITPAGASL